MVQSNLARCGVIVCSLLAGAACSGRTAKGNGACQSNGDCAAGQICNAKACVSLCVRDAECATGEICSGSVCQSGQRQQPQIDMVNGDGTTECKKTPGFNCIAAGIIVTGKNLEGASFLWAASGAAAGSAKELTIRPGADATHAGLDLPADTAPGTYSLTVTNAVGSANQALQLLQGEPGPAMDANAMVQEINTASTPISTSVLPVGSGPDQLVNGQALSDAVDALSQRIDTLQTELDATRFSHPPILDTADGKLAAGSLTAVGASTDGGSISYAGGDTAILMGRRVTLPAFSKANLAINTIYHMRYEFDGTNWAWLVKTPPYAVAGMNGTGPKDEKARYYDSNPQSMLVATIQTSNTAGNAATPTLLVNRLSLVAGSSDENGHDGNVTYSGCLGTTEYFNGTFTSTLNWARTPYVAEAGDSQNRDDAYNQGTNLTTYAVSRYAVNIVFQYHSQNTSCLGSPGGDPYVSVLLIAP